MKQQTFLVQGELDSKRGFVLFWKKDEPDGWACNWFESPFKVGGVSYTCSEMYMMHQKALLMGDHDIAEAILAEDNPARQKKLGQRVKPWDEEKWLANRCRIMYEGCMAKFQQNKELGALLLATGDKVLVEASPLDKIWGVGLKASDPNARRPAAWQGLNLLGGVLMKVRSDMREASAANEQNV